MDQLEASLEIRRLDIDEWNRKAGDWFVRASRDHSADGEVDLLRMCRLMLEQAPEVIRAKLPELGDLEEFDRLLLADAPASAAMHLWNRASCGYMLSRRPDGRVIGSVWIVGEAEESSFDARSEGVALAGALLLAIKAACSLEGWPGSTPLRAVDN